MAIMTVPWPIGTEFPEECRYNTLLQISIGQVRQPSSLAGFARCSC